MQMILVLCSCPGCKDTFLQVSNWFQSDKVYLRLERTCAIIVTTAQNYSHFQTASHIHLAWSSDLRVCYFLYWQKMKSWTEAHNKSIYKTAIHFLFFRYFTVLFAFVINEDNWLRNFWSQDNIWYCGQREYNYKVQVIRKRAIETILRMKYRETCREVFKKNRLNTAKAMDV